MAKVESARKHPTPADIRRKKQAAALKVNLKRRKAPTPEKPTKPSA
jgi:hypothetical protein